MGESTASHRGNMRLLREGIIPLSEEMHVVPVRCDPSVSTKWRVLSEVVRVFDPLSLPVTVSGMTVEIESHYISLHCYR